MRNNIAGFIKVKRQLLRRENTDFSSTAVTLITDGPGLCPELAIWPNLEKHHRALNGYRGRAPVILCASEGMSQKVNHHCSTSLCFKAEDPKYSGTEGGCYFSTGPVWISFLLFLALWAAAFLRSPGPIHLCQHINDLNKYVGHLKAEQKKWMTPEGSTWLWEQRVSVLIFMWYFNVFFFKQCAKLQFLDFSHCCLTIRRFLVWILGRLCGVSCSIRWLSLVLW